MKGLVFVNVQTQRGDERRRVRDDMPLAVVSVSAYCNGVHGVDSAVEVNDKRRGLARARPGILADGNHHLAFPFSVRQDVIGCQFQAHSSSKFEVARIAPGDATAFARAKHHRLGGSIRVLQKDDIAIAGCFKCSRSLEKRITGVGVGAQYDRISVHTLEEYLRAIGNLELRGVVIDRAEIATFKQDTCGDIGVLVADEQVGRRSVRE